jgi:hypothetical protein
MAIKFDLRMEVGMEAFAQDDLGQDGKQLLKEGCTKRIA